MSELLTAITFELPGSEGAARVVEITKFEGDASVNIRKGNKKFAVFDLSVTCAWEGECVDAEGKETTRQGRDQAHGVRVDERRGRVRVQGDLSATATKRREGETQAEDRSRGRRRVRSTPRNLRRGTRGHVRHSH